MTLTCMQDASGRTGFVINRSLITERAVKNRVSLALALRMGHVAERMDVAEVVVPVVQVRI